MPDTLDIGSLQLCVSAEPLTAAAFAPFGDVVENPRVDVHPSHYAAVFGRMSPNDVPHAAVSANQGSAIKYQRVSTLADYYAGAASPSLTQTRTPAPSGRPSTPLASLFVCAARPLVDGVFFPVTILERHPYTTQTFVPLIPAGPSRPTRYLVIVAPTMAPESALQTRQRTIAQPPDLSGLRAFVARGDQAVTYGAGTWHAPMAALGPRDTALPFFVFQFANGVGPEDCEEVVFESGCADDTTGASVLVRVPPSEAGKL